MEQLYHNDLVGAIGLRDCTVYQLQQLMASSKLAPSIVSVEVHPYHNNWDLKKFCKKQVMHRTYCQHLPRSGGCRLQAAACSCGFLRCTVVAML